jgi:hypothetical protein
MVWKSSLRQTLRVLAAMGIARRALALLAALLVSGVHAAIAQEPDRTVLPIPPSPFRGTVGTTYATSSPDPP